MSDWLYISPEDWTEDLKILKEIQGKIDQTLKTTNTNKSNQ